MEIVIAAPVRTAIGGYNGALKGVPTSELGAIAVREALRRSNLGPDNIGTAILSNVV